MHSSVPPSVPPSVQGAELLDSLVENLTLLQGQYFGHISQCADQILANLFGIRKALGTQPLQRGPVDRVRQEEIVNFPPGGAHPVVRRFHILGDRRGQRDDLVLLFLRGIDFDRRMFHNALDFGLDVRIR